MTTYRCSNGDRVTKEEINSYVRMAKLVVLQDQLNDHGYNFCVDCQQYGYPEKADEMELRMLDCSHDVSVKECQEMGKSEIAWDVTNIHVRCRHHHRLLDKTNLHFTN